MSHIHVLIDGDNIQYETYLNHVKDNLEIRFGTDYVPVVFCQTNILIKYRSMKQADVKIVCTKTTNKNASDARIVLEVGKLISKDSNCKTIIVSNDKIFEEIQDNKQVFIVGYTSTQKRIKLKKNNVIQAVRTLTDQRESESDDVQLCDLYTYLNCNSIARLREYICRFVPELIITASDSVFFVTH